MKKYLNLREGVNVGTSFVVSRASYSQSWKWRHINLSYLEKVAPKNFQLFLNLILTFRSESVASLEKIKLQYANRDFPALEKTAHAMKPSGTYIGVNSLTMLVSSLEHHAASGNQPDIDVLVKEIETLVHDVNAEIDEYLKAA